MTNARTTRLLIVVFIGLLGIATLISLARPNTVARAPFPTAQPEVFPGIEQTQITRIELLNRQTGHKLTLTRVPGDWTGIDEKGQSIQVDLAQVARMIQILPTLRYNRQMEAADVKAFGLADGGLFVVNFEAGGKPYTLHIGDLNSALTYAYAQRSDGGPVLQISAIQAKTLVRLVDNPTP